MHETAVVHPDAEIATDAQIGAFVVIDGPVRVAAGVRIGPHCVIEGHTEIGAGTRIHAQACIGGPPQDPAHDGSATRVQIGAGCHIREHVTVHAGSSTGRGLTTVGDGTLLMAGSHVAHDSIVGAGVTVATGATLSASVEVGDGAVIGSLAGLHPNVRIGRLALVGAGALCAQDVPPFTLAQGDRARLYGLNIAGLRAADIAPERLRALKTAWRHIFTSGHALRTGLRLARESVDSTPEVEDLLSFLEASSRGVCRAGVRGA